jgi:hypothetical protein
MAISTLNKISVPLASDASASNQGLLMPKLQYRFRVTLENFGSGDTPRTELTKQVIDVTRPNVSFEEIPLEVYNSKAFIAGKHTWEPITLNLREDINGNVQRLVGTQLQRQVNFTEQSSANSGLDYKFLTRIEILDGGNGLNAPEVLESFELYGCYLTSTNYNSLGYGNNEPVTIELSIRYDNAIQDAGIGDFVPRTGGDLATGAGFPF